MTKPKWKATANQHRHRKMVMLTLAPETVVALDAMKGRRSRGKVIDELVAHAAEEASIKVIEAVVCSATLDMIGT